MSNNTIIETVEIKNANAIFAAVAELQREGVKCELVENQTPRLYNERMMAECGECDYVLKLHDSAYDVGFKRKEDNSYSMVLDTYRAEVGQIIGSKSVNWKKLIEDGKHGHYVHPEHGTAVHVGHFAQTYTKHAVMQKAAQQGHTVKSCGYNAKGKLILVVGVK